jgi:acetyl esterase/lipase
MTSCGIYATPRYPANASDGDPIRRVRIGELCAIAWQGGGVRSQLVAIAAGVALVTAACSGESDTGTPAGAGASQSPAVALSADYLPGLAADLRVPSGNGPATLVVLVPGGGWQSADPAGLVPLAELLTDEGNVTATITYSTIGQGATFPRPADDVACAVRWAAEEASAAGRSPTEIVVLGHSAGGHLASLVALSGSEFGADCPAPPVGIEGLIGLAGVYDVRPLGSSLDSLFGASIRESPALWSLGNPIEWAGHPSPAPDDLRVLLLHGDADTSVPLEQTESFADALMSSGIDVTVVVLPGQTHGTIYDASVAGPEVTTWLAGGV